MKKKKKTIKRIHVDQHVVKRNAKKGKGPYEPACTIQNRGKSIKCFEADIQGPSVVKYSPEKPLGCGARVWVETTSVVVADEEIID